MITEDAVEKKQESEGLTLDFSKQTLKRIERASDEQQSAVALILDNNEIQKLDNLETYPNLRKLSLVNNQIIRMYGVSSLIHLETLDLSGNSLVTIEGLKELKELKHLILAKNRLKTIEHITTNIKLETIDLSENSIVRITDLNFLENLKELYLHSNRICHLTHCERKLPKTLTTLTLHNNDISDLNEVCHLVQLTSLKELSLANNPCLDSADDQKFNYRPFVKNWCSSLVILDKCPLDDIECLKAEWLYSQGRGRSYRLGEHLALVEYLASVCPKEIEENSETEDVKKLKLILSKAQLHQQQLREQDSTGKMSSGEGLKTSLLKKKNSGFADRMVTSYQDSVSKDSRHSSDIMTRSLDGGVLRKSTTFSKLEVSHTPLQASTTFIPIPDTLISPDVSQPVIGSHPRPSSISSRTSRSSSRNSPHSTPESKRKLQVLQKQNKNTSPVAKSHERTSYSRSSTPLELSSGGYMNVSKNFSSPGEKKGLKSRLSEKNCKETSEEEDSEILALKVKAVQQRATQRRQNKLSQIMKRKEKSQENENFKEKPRNLEAEFTKTEEWKAAICIQKWWRGYRTRNLNQEVLAGCKDIQMSRMQDYITKVLSDMEATRMALEGNRKLVVLQMQAINALWKKMAALQPALSLNSEESKSSLQSLVDTCSNLNKQVETLQSMMSIMQASTAPNALIPTSTQTEIVAVHTPQGEEKKSFPYIPTLKSKSTNEINLSYSSSSNDEDKSAKTSGSSLLNALTEIFMNSTLNDASENSFVSCGIDNTEVQVVSVNLTKPEVKLNENAPEETSKETNEVEKSKMDDNTQNAAKC